MIQDCSGRLAVLGGGVGSAYSGLRRKGRQRLAFWFLLGAARQALVQGLGLVIPLVVPAPMTGTGLSCDTKTRCSHLMAFAQHGTNLQANGLFTEHSFGEEEDVLTEVAVHGDSGREGAV